MYPMRIIQSGVGGFGMSWVYAVKDCDGFQHVAIVDPNPKVLREAMEVLQLPPERCFSNLPEALAKVSADGLIDVTPAPLHEFTSISAMEAGLHVLCEKPISNTIDSARKMTEVARQTNRTLMVTQQYRYQDQPRCIRQMIREDVIGPVDHIVAEFQIQGLLFGWRKTMAHPFLMDMAVHHFDMMRYLLGENALKVTAQTWNPVGSGAEGDMNAFAWIEFESGARVNYTGAFSSPGTDTGWNGRWTITGSKGSLVWNSRDEWGPIRLFRQNADLHQYQEMHFFTPLPEVWGEVIQPGSMGATGHHYDLYHWRACIESGAEPETSGRDNLNTLALTLGAIESANSGKSVEIESILDTPNYAYRVYP